MGADTDLLDARLADLGARIARLLAADVRVFLPQVVRDRFADTPSLGEALDDDALAKLKREVLETADQLGAEVEKRLGPPTAWLDAATPAADAGAAPTLMTHPPVADTVAHIEHTVAGVLAQHGLDGDGPTHYRLPMRFIDGENLATLTLNFWKAVARRNAQRAKADASAAARAHADRKRRWDEL